MRQITVYEYDELPTEEAKERAREWWIEREMENPAWVEEHFRSMNVVIERVKAIETDEDFRQLLQDSEEGKLTGYCADALFYDLAKDRDITPLPKETEDYYVKKWDEELTERINNREEIEENIRINKYEFFENGQRV